jgi:hypothetical protein
MEGFQLRNKKNEEGVFQYKMFSNELIVTIYMIFIVTFLYQTYIINHYPKRAQIRSTLPLFINVQD